jgi:hypothetical protein
MHNSPPAHPFQVHKVFADHIPSLNRTAWHPLHYGHKNTVGHLAALKRCRTEKCGHGPSRLAQQQLLLLLQQLLLLTAAAAATALSTARLPHPQLPRQHLLLQDPAAAVLLLLALLLLLVLLLVVVVLLLLRQHVLQAQRGLHRLLPAPALLLLLLRAVAALARWRLLRPLFLSLSPHHHLAAAAVAAVAATAVVA